MFSTKLSVSIHLLLLSVHVTLPLTSLEASKSIQTNPVVLRKLMSKLHKAGLIDIKKNQGITALKKHPSEITLLEIFKAVEDNQMLFDVHHTSNINCQVGATIEEKLTGIYRKMDVEFHKYLAGVTLENFIKGGLE